MQKKIIIIDDDQCLLESITDALMLEGYEVVTATSGEGLCEQVRILRPDLVILDMKLPGEQGDVLAMQLKADGQTKYVPIILISASEDLRSRFEEVGADGHLAKPFDLNKFVNLINVQISQTRH